TRLYRVGTKGFSASWADYERHSNACIEA
ncbi:MAG: hypothetical protein ACI944_002795, partial [Natronomonas sp.]